MSVVTLDALGNKINDMTVLSDKLAELLGKFQHDEGFILEGKLWIGSTVAWFQRAPNNEMEVRTWLKFGPAETAIKPNDVGHEPFLGEHPQE